MEARLDASIIGVDLGQSRDYTAICVTEKRQNYKGWPNEAESIGDPFYNLIRLDRLKLGTPYTQVREIVRAIYQALKQGNKKPELVIDYTGVGRPVFDMFKEASLYPRGINIHGGDAFTRDGPIDNVPKRDLAAVLQVVYQQERINVAAKLKMARVLNDELLSFQVKINAQTGHDSYEHRSGQHDDLVLAVACACWYGERGLRRVMASNLKRKLGL